VTGQVFLHQLDTALRPLPADERQDILYDYTEHLRIAMENGTSEEDAVAALGKPKALAKELLADYGLRRAERDQSFRNVTRAALAIISLGFFNVVFVLGPLVAVCAVLLVLNLVGALMSIIPLLVGLGLLVGIVDASGYSVAVNVFLLCLLEGIGLFLLAGAVTLTRISNRGFLSYLRYNLRVIKGDGAK
jgi:uncharacterized membrane protein